MIAIFFGENNPQVRWDQTLGDLAEFYQKAGFYLKKINNMNMLEAALEYRTKFGFSIFPQNKFKIPLLKEIIPFRTKLPEIQEIEKWWGKDYPRANIAIITGALSNLLVIDCDTLETSLIIEELLPDSLIVPKEKTPRGGTHFYFRYPQGNNLKGGYVQKDIEIKGEDHNITVSPSFNKDGKYEWIIKPTPGNIPEVPEKLLQFILEGRKQWGRTNSSIKTNSFSVCVDGDTPSLADNRLQPSTKVYTGQVISFEEPGRDITIFHIANSLCRSGMPIENVRKVIEFIGCNCKPAFPPRELEAKIKSVLQRAEKRERPIAEDIRGFLECLQVGTFCLRDVYTHLHVSTRDDKKAVWIALKRLEGDIVEKTGTQAGHYKIMNKNLKPINLKDKSDVGNELDIKFPMGVHEFIKPMPGCIYIVAGEPDSGKSAYLMNFAKKNYKKNRVHYFSSEMGKEEFLDRLQYGWPEAGEEQNMCFYERDGDFDQVIFPDDINIIDYLTLFDNFYLMAGLIDAISKKLKKGIAFIAIQKPRGRDEALGGDRTKDLARLYITMEYQRMKIIKAKNWRDPKFNPNKLSICYELHQGFNFKTTTPWKKEDEKYVPKNKSNNDSRRHGGA